MLARQANCEIIINESWDWILCVLGTYTDIRGPSHPINGLFRYLMVLINVYLYCFMCAYYYLATWCLQKMLAQIICYMHNFLQISSFNDEITTHLKGGVIEHK